MDIKPYKTLDEQIALLKQKNLIIVDEIKAKNILANINYYRFINAYGLELFDKVKDKYVEGTTFQLLYEIYECDKSIRHVFFTKIETVEIKLRTAIAYILGRISPLSYSKNNIYKKAFDLNKFLESVYKEVEKQKKTPLVMHHNNYGAIPIWALVEILPFGTLSILYCNLDKNLQKEILAMVITKEKKPGVPYFTRWIHQISILRNICAHYSRLYDKKFEKVDLKTCCTKYDSEVNGGKLFDIILLIMKVLSYDDCRELMEDIVNIKINFKNVDFSKYGFLADWNDILLLHIENKLL